MSKEIRGQEQEEKDSCSNSQEENSTEQKFEKLKSLRVRLECNSKGENASSSSSSETDRNIYMPLVTAVRYFKTIQNMLIDLDYEFSEDIGIEINVSRYPVQILGKRNLIVKLFW